MCLYTRAFGNCCDQRRFGSQAQRGGSSGDGDCANFPNRPQARFIRDIAARCAARKFHPPVTGFTHCFNSLSTSSTLLSRWAENVTPSTVTSGVAALGLPTPGCDLFQFLAHLCHRQHPPGGLAQAHPAGAQHTRCYFPKHWSAGEYPAGPTLSPSVKHLIAGSPAARTVIILSEQFAKTYRELRHIPGERLAVIPNWIPANSVVVGSKEAYRKDRDIRQELYACCMAAISMRLPGLKT